VSLTEQWDDNIFRTSSQREADFLTRVTPGFSAGYQSQPLTLLGSFAFDSEIFAEHPNLDGAANGKRAGLQATYLPTRNLTLGLKSAYTETQTPSVLNTITNVEQGRAKATQTNASPTASYQLTPRMAGDATYSYTRTTVGTASGTSSTSATVAGLTTVTHRADLSLTRQLTPGLVVPPLAAPPDESTRTAATVAPRPTAADLGAVAYGLTVSEFEGFPSITSHTLTLGWTHYFTALTSVSLRAGPRYTEGAINPEVDAEIVHQGRSVRLSLAYFRSETTLVGQAGTAKTQGARGSLGWTPLRGMTVTVTPSWAQTSSEVSATTQSLTSQDITVYASDVSLSYQLTRWLTAGAAYHYTRQEQRPAAIEDNIVLLRLEIAYPLRLH
jgi:predicted porin